MIRSLKCASRAVLSIIAVALSFIAFTPSASAAPTVDYLLCESGGSKFMCTLSYSGAVGSVTVRWDVYANNTYLYTTYANNLSLRACSPGTFYGVQVYLTDSTGTTHTSSGVGCSRDQWN